MQIFAHLGKWLGGAVCWEFGGGFSGKMRTVGCGFEGFWCADFLTGYLLDAVVGWSHQRERFL